MNRDLESAIKVGRRIERGDATIDVSAWLADTARPLLLKDGEDDFPEASLRVLRNLIGIAERRLQSEDQSIASPGVTHA